MLLGDMMGKNIVAYLAGLKVKLSKCEFLKNLIRFLGHEVDSSGIHTQADKIQAISTFRCPLQWTMSILSWALQDITVLLSTTFPKLRLP